MERTSTAIVQRGNDIVVDVQTLGGLKQYVTGYLVTRERSAATKVKENARRATEREDAVRGEYDAYRRKETAQILAQLPKAARTAIENDARPPVASFTGRLREQMLEVRKRMLTAQRYGDRIKSFEEWNATHRTR